MNNKWLENVLIVTLIGIILCLLFPVIQKIIYDADLSGTESSAYASIDSVKLLYMKENVNNKIILPFTVDYNEDSYKVYVNGDEYNATEKIETSGRKPIGGSIILMPSGNVTVVSLKYKSYTCSKPPNGDLECQRDS